MEVTKVDAFMNNHDYVRVTDMRRIIELQYMQHWNKTCPILKLNRSEYLVKSTGEIGTYNLSKTRRDNMNSMRQSFKRLSYLINANFSGANNELWITLTFKKDVYDHDEALNKFKKFIMRLRYYSKKRWGGYGHLEFVRAIEPHEKGDWHFHMLLKYSALKKVFIENEEFANIWKHGYVKIQRPEKTDNIGAYFTSYLTNLEVNEEDFEGLTPEEEEKHVSELLSVPGARNIEYTKSNKSKRVIKGGRLHLYPSGMQLYNTSRGIKMPSRKDMTRKKAIKRYKIKAQNLTLRKSLLIKDLDNDFENILIIEQYNLGVWKEDSILALREAYAEELARCYEEGAETWRIAYFMNELDKIENKYKRLQAIEENKQAQVA